MTDHQIDLHLSTINRVTEIFRQTEWLRHEVESLRQEFQALHDDPDSDDATKRKLSAELERWAAVNRQLDRLAAYNESPTETTKPAAS